MQDGKYDDKGIKLIFLNIINIIILFTPKDPLIRLLTVVFILGVAEQQANIKKHITEIFEGSDEELQDKIQSFEAERKMEKDRIAEMERNKNDLDIEIKKINGIIQKKQIDIGRLKEEIKQHQEKIAESKEHIEKLRVELGLDEFGPNDDRLNIYRKLEEKLETSQANFKNLEEQHDSEEKSLQKQIDDARVRYASTTEKITSKDKSIRECNAKVKDICRKLNELDTSDSQLKSIENRIEKLQASLTKYKESFNEAAKLQEIEEHKDTVKKKEQELEKLEKEFRVLQNNYVTEQKLDSLNTFLIEKQGEISRIMNKHSEGFKKLFGDSMPERKLKESVEKILFQEENKYKLLTTRISKLENEIASTKTKVNMNKRMLENEKKEQSKLEKKVSNLCQGRAYKELLNETANKKEKLQKTKGHLSSAKILYEEFAKKFEETPCCPICQTDFTQKKNLIGDITTKLRAKVVKLPEQIDQTNLDLRKVEDLYNKLQQLSPVYEQIELLTSAKIPKLETEISELNNSLEEKSLELFSEQENTKAPQELLKICKEVVSDAALFDQYNVDIKKARDSITDLEGDIVKVPSNRSRQEAEAEIDSMKSQLNMLKNQLESAKEMLDNHKERCQNYNKEIQNQTQRQIDIQMLMNEKPLLEKEKKECEEKLTILNEEIEQLSIDKISQEQDLKTLIEQRQSAVQNNKKLRQVEHKKLIFRSSILADIDKVHKELSRFERNNSEEKLRVAVDNLATTEVKKEEIEKNKNSIIENISKKKQSLATRDSEFRALSDNVLLREKKKTEEKLDNEIKQLKEKIGGYNYRTVYEEKQVLEKQIEKAKRDINLLQGQKDEVKKQIQELEKELDKPQIKNAYKEFKKQASVLRMHETAIEDTTNYVNVLEQSVLQFHKERMVQINRIIRELWRSIYRGNDIDYIEIKNDATTGSTSKRIYNYSVVQVKNNVELEMRGRCSAGQKVLACLVIRMALAETFSNSCGILALDEPTTNLDRENIHSLSDALARIISSREREQNFQLLIITHDEEFLNTLSRMQSLESYYRVKRDNNGFSMIEKHYL